MFGKKVFAAMLATVLGASLFGASVAKAVIHLDLKTGAVTYATETLPALTDDGYSVVMGPGDQLDVTGKVGLGGPNGSFVTVRFELSGMVFSAAVTAGDLDIAGEHDDPSLRSGGQVGDAHVSFIVSRSMNTEASDLATLMIGQFGVTPGVPGSVTMTVTDSLGDAEMYTESYPSAVLTKRALTEKPMPMNLVATVETRFKSFRSTTPNGPPAVRGTLGSFVVGANVAFLHAETGSAVAVVNIIATDDTSSVTISGDFSFASAAWLDDDDMCARTPVDDFPNLVQTEGETVMDDLMAQPPSAFAADATPYLCISLHEGDEAKAIPETAYMVTTKYAVGTEDAGWPPNPGEYSLGRITRDGTTVHIPYLTTWADYNQRIVVSNRGTNPAPYWITFRPEDGVTYTEGMYATGTLDGGSTIVLRVMDVVTLEGRTRTAATFVAEAQSSQIDVATVIVNLMTGGTDTVNYDPEPTD